MSSNYFKGLSVRMDEYYRCICIPHSSMICCLSFIRMIKLNTCTFKVIGRMRQQRGCTCVSSLTGSTPEQHCQRKRDLYCNLTLCACLYKILSIIINFIIYEIRLVHVLQHVSSIMHMPLYMYDAV